MSSIITYIRDGRAPIPKDTNISKVMSANRAKDTKPELKLRKTLYQSGMKGYRLYWKKIPGRPDICYPGRKLAIFVNGCFWHRCPICDLELPKSNPEFWKEKFTKNKDRDKRKIIELEALGWKVLPVWECQINDEIEVVIKTIERNWRIQ